ncbi:serine/threonine-protein kinase [Planosporangium sp. 12N6]|uniref:serine/threonine-protein kinase n=1 Tax=Planosporangium spinosum TaxID=3402278 RepID=UPI003CF5A537
MGSYRLVRRLGVGGMGTVFLGQAPDGRLVAVKVVHPHLCDDPVFRDRFASEVAAARRVSGFGAARVLDADVAGRRPYLVTEYIEGVTLHDRVRARGPLTESDAYALAVGVAAALTAIHAAAVVHRDLTPRNVMLSPLGPRVVDFGIARALDPVAPATAGPMFGTPGWLAPEQLLLGQPAGPPADVFAWGLLVAWASTGRHPYGGAGPQGTARAPVGPPALAGVAPRLAPIVTAALHPEPSARPTARDLLLTLCGSADARTVQAATAHLTHAGTPAGPPPATPPPAAPPAPTPPTAAFRRPRRRRRTVALVTASALVVLCCLGALNRRGDNGGAGSAGGPPARTPSGPPTGRDGDLEFVVTGLHCGATQLGEPPVTRTAQGQFCVLAVRVTDRGRKAGRVWAGSQRLLDAAGKEYRADDWSFVYYAESRPLTADINPGNTVTGSLVFDVPAGITFTRLVVRDTPLSFGTTIALG